MLDSTAELAGELLVAVAEHGDEVVVLAGARRLARDVLCDRNRLFRLVARDAVRPPRFDWNVPTVGARFRGVGSS